jgi:hypothetical protein
MLLKEQFKSFNTLELAQTFKKYVSTNNLSIQAIATRLGYNSRVLFNRLITNPRPWVKCSNKAKQIYQRMDALLKNDEPILKSCTAKNMRGSFTPLAVSTVTYNAENNATPLNTAIIARNVDRVLDRHGISAQKLACKFLGVSKSYLAYCMNDPTPWRRCSEYKRGVYKCLYDWTQSEQQIALLRDMPAK